MDVNSPFSQVLLGVLANAITAAASNAYRIGKATVLGEDEGKKGPTLHSILEQSLEDLSETIEWTGPPRIEEVCLFLTSPETEAVVRQLCAAELMEDEDVEIGSIRNEFHSLFARYFDLNKRESKTQAYELFTRLRQSTDRALSAAVEAGLLSAHEAKSNLRFRLLKADLQTLKKNLALLTSRPKLDVTSILQFGRLYREQIVDRHGRITPPNFDDARKLPIDSIFVPPNFRTKDWPNLGLWDIKIRNVSSKLIRNRLVHAASTSVVDPAAILNQLQLLTSSRVWAENVRSTLDTLTVKPEDLSIGNLWYSHDSLSMDQILSSIYRTVVLGNPGGGKSTFTNKVCYDLASRPASGELGEKLFTPMPVVLREFGSEKKTNKISILKFLELTCNARYQLDPPEGAFEYLLLNGHAVVIFDGLDELLDTSYRQEIRDDIESFCSLYPSVPVIVTSREVGYEQAPLDRKQFQTFYLAPFDEEQVSHYVKNWFDAGTELPAAQKEQKARDFLQESEIVSDLRSNPLMLGLMCNIYRGENYIPRNRPDVYRKCAEMLFERWDRSRDIPVQFHFEDDIRPAMAYLAHWIYANPKLQEGVTEQGLVSNASDYLLSHKYEDRDLAERAAREFIEFCRGRAWVFTETGTDKNGNGIYQFTHRTFLEYFTAVYLVRTHETTEALVKKLLPRILKQEWDIVAQLAFQIKNRSAEGATDNLLKLVLDHMQKSSSIRALHLLFFASRCLEFMEPSPKVLRDLMSKFLRNCVTNIPNQNKPTEKAQYARVSEAILRALMSAGRQNRGTISDSIKRLVLERSDSRITDVTKRALEIGLHLADALSAPATNRETPTELRDYWLTVSDQIATECHALIISTAPSDFAIAVDAFQRQIVTAADVFKWHGSESLFRATSFDFFNGIREHSVAVQLLSTGISALHRNALDDPMLRELGTIGNMLSSTATPFINDVLSKIDLACLVTLEQLDESTAKKPPQIESVRDSLFGGFVLLATLRETRKELKSKFKTLAEDSVAREGGRISEPLIVYLKDQVSLEFQAANLLHSDIEDSLKNSRSSLLGSLHNLLIARAGDRNDSLIQNILDECMFTPAQQSFVWSWIRAEIDLVKTETTARTQTDSFSSTSSSQQVGAKMAR